MKLAEDIMQKNTLFMLKLAAQGEKDIRVEGLVYEDWEE